MRVRIVHGAVLAALTATGIAWVSLDKAVTVEIDGESRVVTTHASTVGEVLERAGIELEAHDILAPAGSDKVGDGTRIVIKRGRLVTVRVNDVERPVWVNAADVDQVLQEIGIDADERTYVSASRSSRVPSTGAFALHVRIPSEVQLVVEGVSRTVVTTAPTVADLLLAEGVRLTANHVVNVPLGSYPAEGTTVVVQDKRGVRIARTRPIPFRTRTSVDRALPAGTLKVVAPGRAGVLVAYFRQLSVAGGPPVTVADGTRIARRPVDRVIVRGPVKVAPAPVVVKPPVVVKAPAPKPAPKPVAKAPAPPRTAPKPAPKPAAKTGVDALNWHALAMCESGNNPRAVSPGGTYRGLYQFMLSTWRGVGGSGDPINASRAEQLLRAKILYKRVGARAWGSCGSRLFR